MAGNYPDVPSWRLATDKDGTVGIYRDQLGVLTQLTQAQMQSLNDESGSSAVNCPNNGALALIFPEKRDVDGIYLAITTQWIGAGGAQQTPVLEYSTDTTNGLDGTWSTAATLNSTQYSYGPSGASPVFVPTESRTKILTLTMLAVRGIRLTWVNGTNNTFTAINAWHVFGEIAPGENPSRLGIWHPTLDQHVIPAHFDWGDVPRSSSADKTFRVKNLSTTKTANSVRIAQEALTDTTPSVVSQHTLSLDGSTFLAQVNVGALAPGVISPVITLRRVTPTNAVFSAWAHRVFAEAGSWT